MTALNEGDLQPALKVAAVAVCLRSHDYDSVLGIWFALYEGIPSNLVMFQSYFERRHPQSCQFRFFFFKGLFLSNSLAVNPALLFHSLPLLVHLANMRAVLLVLRDLELLI